MDEQRRDLETELQVLANARSDLNTASTLAALAKSGVPSVDGHNDMELPEAMRFRIAESEASIANVVNLSATRIIDARFLGLLLMLNKQLKVIGANLGFTGGSPRLKRLFRLNLANFLLSAPTLDETRIERLAEPVAGARRAEGYPTEGTGV